MTCTKTNTTKPKTIDEFSDKELAQMVRDSIYVKGTRFGAGKTDAQYFLVFAVPYGKDDGVRNLPEAIDAFARLIQDSDWEERTIQVYEHTARQQYYPAVREELR